MREPPPIPRARVTGVRLAILLSLLAVVLLGGLLFGLYRIARVAYRLRTHVNASAPAKYTGALPASNEGACERAESYCRQGDQKTAEALLDRFLAERTPSDRTLFFRGVLYRSRWREYAAGRCFERVVRGRPASWEARCARAVLRFDSDTDQDAAFQELVALADERPDDPLGQWLVASLCRLAHRGVQGEAAARRVLARWNPGPSMAHYALANALDEQGRHEEALVHRLIVLQTDADKAYAHDACGRTYVSLKRYDEALREHELAVAMAPGSGDYRIDLAMCQLAMGRKAEALRNLNDPRSGGLDDKDIQFFLGKVLQETAPAAARPHFERAAALGSPYAMYRLGDLHVSGALGVTNMAEAVAWMKRAADLGNGGACYDLGCWHYNGNGSIRRDWKTSFTYFEQGAKLGHTSCMTMLAWQLQRGEGVKRDGEAALQWYRRAAALGDTFCLYKVAQTLENGWGVARDLKGSFAAYQAVYDRHGAMFAEAAASLGWNYLHGLGVESNRAEGLRLYEEAVASGNDWVIESYATWLDQHARTAAERDRGFELALRGAEQGHAGLCNLAAWQMATSTNAARWDGARAVLLAGRALKQEPGNTEYLDTLAAAYARAGRFSEAVETQRHAIELLEAKPKKPEQAFLQSFRDRLERYERSEPVVVPSEPSA